MDEILNKIVEVGSEEGGTILHRLGKLSEESGELASAILLKDGYKMNKHNYSEIEITDNILEEGVDTLIVVFDLLIKSGFSIDEIKDKFDEKIVTWKKVVDSKK